MRVIAEIAQPEFKVTILSWNQKYLVKFEQGLLEQTYKVSELDLRGEADARKLACDPVMVAEVLERFKAMRATLSSALDRL